VFDSNNQPLEEIRAALLDADAQTIEDTKLYVKLLRIKSPWRRRLISFVVDTLLFIDTLSKAFPRKR
jgi:hypothetical protein